MNIARGLRNFAVAYAGGSVGGLANSAVAWLCGVYGITARLAVEIHPAFTPAWLYPRLVWGGIWGLLFLLPYKRRSIFVRGLVYSLVPSLFQLLYLFPSEQDLGWFGAQLGNWTFLFVLLFNAIWGWVVAVVIVAISERRNPVHPQRSAASAAEAAN